MCGSVIGNTTLAFNPTSSDVGTYEIVVTLKESNTTPALSRTYNIQVKITTFNGSMNNDTVAIPLNYGLIITSVVIG